MKQTLFPTIDPEATGQNIIRLRKQKGLTVRDLQNWFGFEEPRAIYKWQTGQSLPSIDNLYALSILLEGPIDHILVGTIYQDSTEPQAAACGSHYSRLSCRLHCLGIFYRSKRIHDYVPYIPCFHDSFLWASGFSSLSAHYGSRDSSIPAHVATHDTAINTVESPSNDNTR